MMLELTRRGFLKVGTALVGGAVVAKYVEPLVAEPASRKFVEDCGDYYIVRIPDRQEVRHELFNKPVLIVMEGPRSQLVGCHIEGFANLYAPNGGLIYGTHFDGTKMVTPKRRAIMEVKEAQGVTIEECNFCGNELISAILFAERNRISQTNDYTGGTLPLDKEAT